MTDTLKQVGSTAVFTAPMRSVGGFENKQKYLKSTYVPPHQRNKNSNSVKNFEKFNGGKKTQNDYTQSYKSQKTNKTNNWRTNNNNNNWRTSASNSDDSQSESAFKNWNKKEQLKKEKSEKVIIKPHCELFLTNLPPAMRTIAGLAAFFHPYGEVAQIQILSPNDDIPEAVMKWCKETDVPPGHSAIVEFLTARTAKFVVGVLRKRLAQLNFRVGLIKPGLGEELTYQRTSFGDIVHQPTNGFNQQFVVTTPKHISDTSSDSSENDSRPPKRFAKRLIAPTRVSDEAYWSNNTASSSSAVSSSETSMTSSSDSESENNRASPISTISEEESLVDGIKQL
jgi:hypothetical protein